MNIKVWDIILLLWRKLMGFEILYFFKKQDSVAVQIDTKLKLEIEENRLFIQPIIETILVWGRQELALRGHKEWCYSI